MHSSTYSKYLQENVVTIRNDRYVLPVKEEYRAQIKGFVHDISSTGSTVFIEPLSIFELNNELNNLKIEEKIEIEKILKNLSQSFTPYTQNLKLDQETIGLLDFVFAKAKYSKTIYGITPIINENKQIIHGIFDVLCINEDKITIIDYKTDTLAKNSSDELLKELHQGQMYYYKKIMKQMFPNKEVEAIVYYLHIHRYVTL